MVWCGSGSPKKSHTYLAEKVDPSSLENDMRKFLASKKADRIFSVVLNLS